MKKTIENQLMKKRLKDIEKELQTLLTFEPSYISDRALFNLNSGGKRIRPVFVVLVASYFKKYDKEVIRLAAVMELIHMSSLIHDDVNDASNLRRGRITINAQDNNDVAIFVGDYILAYASKCIKDLPHYTDILSILADAAMKMSEGEVIQLRSLFDVEQTIENYNERIARKTALLIAISCKSGALLADAKDYEQAIFYEFGYHLGMAFQIKDDLMDLLSDDKDMGKPTGNDLASGLINLPTILLLNKDFPEKEEVRMSIQEQFPNGDKDVQRIVELINKSGVLQETEDILMEHIAAAKSVLDGLKSDPILDALRKGADYIHERTV